MLLVCVHSLLLITLQIHSISLYLVADYIAETDILHFHIFTLKHI